MLACFLTRLQPCTLCVCVSVSLCVPVYIHRTLSWKSRLLWKMMWKRLEEPFFRKCDYFQNGAPSQNHANSWLMLLLLFRKKSSSSFAGSSMCSNLFFWFVHVVLAEQKLLEPASNFVTNVTHTHLLETMYSWICWKLFIPKFVGDYLFINLLEIMHP